MCIRKFSKEPEIIKQIVNPEEPEGLPLENFEFEQNQVVQNPAIIIDHPVPNNPFVIITNDDSILQVYFLSQPFEHNPEKRKFQLNTWVKIFPPFEVTSRFVKQYILRDIIELIIDIAFQEAITENIEYFTDDKKEKFLFIIERLCLKIGRRIIKHWNKLERGGELDSFEIFAHKKFII